MLCQAGRYSALYLTNIQFGSLGRHCTSPYSTIIFLDQYGFDQQRLIWHVFRLWDMVCNWRFERQSFVGVVCSDEGLTLETSATHHIPQAKNMPYQPLVDQTHRYSAYSPTQKKQFLSKVRLPVFTLISLAPKLSWTHSNCLLQQILFFPMHLQTSVSAVQTCKLSKNSNFQEVRGLQTIKWPGYDGLGLRSSQ